MIAKKKGSQFPVCNKANFGEVISQAQLQNSLETATENHSGYFSMLCLKTYKFLIANMIADDR